MSLRKKIERVTSKQRVLDGAWLIVFLFLATQMIGGLLFGSSQVVQPLPLPELRQGNYKALEKYASELIIDEMDRNNIVGLSAAIIVGDRIVWSKGYGYADRETNKPATLDTVYRVGSISKIPNAIAVLKFKAAGKVDLDVPINSYIPELKVKSRFATEQAFTPHLLMTHHSGLPSDIVKGMWGEKPAPFQSVVSLLAEEYLAYPPRTIHSYSNLGAGLLGVMLERISGSEYEDVMQESVLQPLGMVNSSYRLQPHIARKLSQGYNIKGQLEKDVEIRDVPAGNLYTSVNDLGKMMIMLLNDGVYDGTEVLPSGLVSKMFAAQNDAVLLDGNFKIGYEFFLKNPALAYVGDDFTHSGHMHLFHANVMGIKKDKIAVVVLANSAGADERVSLIAEQLLKGAVAVKRDLLPPKVKSVQEVVLALPTALQEAASYAGNYGTIIGLLEVQELRKGSYVAKLEGKKLNLLPDKDGWLRPEYRLWGILPLSHPKLKEMRIAFRTVNGEDVVFAQLGSEVPAVGKRIREYNLPEAWRNRQGVYRTNDEENQLLEIDSLTLNVNKQGYLMMSMQTDTKAQLGELVLYPVSDREAVIYALGWRMMETISVRQEADGEKLIFSGISFTKQ